MFFSVAKNVENSYDGQRENKNNKMKEKAVYKFQFDCGRQGELEGLFVSTKEKVQALKKSEVEVYFGEVLGKHSEVYGKIEEKEIILVSDNPEVVQIVEQYNLENGYNPFDYTVLGQEDDMTADEFVDEYIKRKG